MQGVRCSEILVLGARRSRGDSHAGVGHPRSESLQLRLLWVIAPGAPPEHVIMVVLRLCLVEAFKCSQPF